MESKAVMSIEDHKAAWVACEEEKDVPRQSLKEIGKRQRPSTKAMKEYMESNGLESLECGSGWTMTCEEVEKVTFSEDVCSSYMATEELDRLKKEQTKCRAVFKTLPPTKRPRVD
jgi:hypothetical protein